MAGLIERFLENLRKFGLEYYGRFYGNYRAKVHNNIDKENRGRIWVTVPSVSGDDVLANQAYPIAPFGGADHGIFFPPETDETVIVCFENGDPQFPMYWGGWWKAPNDTPEIPDEFKQDDPTTESPKRRGIKTPGGHVLLFDDTEGEESVRLQHKSNAFINIDKNGSIDIRNPNGSLINVDVENKAISVIDENSNSFLMNEDGIQFISKDQHFMSMVENFIQLVSQKDIVLQCANASINAGGVTVGSGAQEPAMLGNQWRTYFTQFLNSWALTHIHPTGVGPSGPATPAAPPLPPTVFSQNVKLK